MTHIEEKRLKAEELIRQHAPGYLQEKLLALLRPAIALTADRAEDAQIAVGTSKFGGAPDVPEGFEWPVWNDEPLRFLAQINLEEVASFDVEDLFPGNGLLSIFIGAEALYDSHWNRNWHVVWQQGPLRRVAPDECKAQSLNCSRMSFAPFWSLPAPDSLEMPYSSMTHEKADEYYDFINLHWYVMEARHHLLGYASSVQQDVRLASNTAHLKRLPDSLTQPSDWLLLLCVDDEERINLDWGDAGVIYFCIRQQDLAERNFDAVEFVYQCL